MFKRVLFVTIMAAMLLLAACGGAEEAVLELLPAPTAAPTAVPTAALLPAPALATNTPLPPTLPPPPPVDTATPVPPPPTPDVTPQVTISVSTGLILAKPEDFANRNPFTGEEVDPAQLQRRPIIVKLSNAPPDYTRPQAGLNDTDILFEHWTEGSVTRFSALFYDTVSENVGPVRSARLIDIELPAMYDSMLAYSGASVGVYQRLTGSDFSDRIMRSNSPGFYRTGDETKPFEHTLYIRMADLWGEVETRGLNTPPRITTYNVFTSEAPPDGTPAGSVVIDLRTSYIEWKYDPEIGRYRRWTDYVEHLDANTEEQVTAANVVYLTPYHVNDPTICEQINNGVCAALSIQIQLWGSGPAIVFRDGQQYPVTWYREGRNDMLTFKDAQGNPFPLQIGNTWVQLVPDYIRTPLTVTP